MEFPDKLDMLQEMAKVHGGEPHTPSAMSGRATGKFCMSKPTAARIRCSVKRN